MEKENSGTPKSDKAKKQKFGTKGTKIMTVAVGAATLGALALAAITMGKTTVAAKDSTTETPTTLELQPEVYDGFMGMMRYFADYDGSTSDTPFITDSETGRLYVIIDGKAYAVVDTEDGLYVADADAEIEDENTPLTPIQDASNGEINPNVYTDANGNTYYHVVWGDTLCSISSDLHISVDELAEYNHIRNVHLIYAESDLRIPQGSYDPNASEYPRDDASSTASTSASN